MLFIIKGKRHRQQTLRFARIEDDDPNVGKLHASAVRAGLQGAEDKLKQGCICSSTIWKEIYKCY